MGTVEWYTDEGTLKTKEQKPNQKQEGQRPKGRRPEEKPPTDRKAELIKTVSR